MDIHTNIPLKNYTTMKLGGPARFMANAGTPGELAELIQRAKQQNIRWFIMGGGSNVIAHDEGFDGLIIRNRIPGFEVVAETDTMTTIRVGAGETWDSVVERVVDMNLQGIEAMSAIPGTAGAAPVQNVGAYGQEIADTLVSLEAYDSEAKRLVSLQNTDCAFSYRDSIFRSSAAGRYAITAITLELYKSRPQPPFYAAVEAYFSDHHIPPEQVTVKEIRTAVTAIRTDKLPDPTERPNAGSFFKNAVIDEWQFERLRKEHDDMPYYDMGEKRYKIPTGWLIEQCGFKGQLLHGMRVNDKNALVLINESATGYADLEAARNEITSAVRDAFRIEIQQEPLELG